MPLTISVYDCVRVSEKFLAAFEPIEGAFRVPGRYFVVSTYTSDFQWENARSLAPPTFSSIFGVMAQPA